MVTRWLPIEHKTVPELQAEERALLAARETKGAPEGVLSHNGLTGQTTVTFPTEDDPSPESRRLGEALAVLADPEAEAPPSTMWEDNSPDARRVKWLREADDARDYQAITSKEWATLLETFGRLGRARGWFGADGWESVQALVRGARG